MHFDCIHYHTKSKIITSCSTAYKPKCSKNKAGAYFRMNCVFTMRLFCPTFHIIAI